MGFIKGKWGFLLLGLVIGLYFRNIILGNLPTSVRTVFGA